MCIPEIRQHMFWSSGSGNILNTNNFQRLKKGIVQDKKKIFFYKLLLCINSGYNFENTISQNLSPILIGGQYLSTVDN